MSSAAMHVQAAACLSPPEVVGAPLTPEDICQRSKGNWSDAKAVPGAKSGSVESAQSVAIVPKRPHAAGRAIARTPSSIVKRCASSSRHSRGSHHQAGVFDANRDARPQRIVSLCETCDRLHTH